MVTTLVLIQLVLVLVCIFIGAKVGGIGMGIYGMVGTLILVFGFGLAPGALPIDVMLIIVSVIVASAALQSTGGLDYLVGQAAKFLRHHPDHMWSAISRRQAFRCQRHQPQACGCALLSAGGCRRPGVKPPPRNTSPNGRCKPPRRPGRSQ